VWFCKVPKLLQFAITLQILAITLSVHYVPFWYWCHRAVIHGAALLLSRVRLRMKKNDAKDMHFIRGGSSISIFGAKGGLAFRWGDLGHINFCWYLQLSIIGCNTKSLISWVTTGNGLSCVYIIYADVAVSRVGQQGGATCDLMTSRDPAHVTVTSLAPYSDVDKSTSCNVDLGVDNTCTSPVQGLHPQPTAADYSLSQQTNITCVRVW